MKRIREDFDFYGAEVLTVIWETKPGRRPLAVVFAANYPKTNFGVSYLESALFLRAEFNGEEGNYCLSMPVTDDMAMAVGRESYGYPKKIGNIQLQSSDYDPWAEVEISRILGAVYTIGNNSMLKASVVGEADPVAFAPYAFAKWDQ